MKQIVLAFFLILNFSLVAQDDAYLYNPSFEGMPRAAKVPDSWKNCDRFGETPPDTHPSGAFGITKSAYEGRTYLGMVIRDNDTWESVGQELKQPLEKDQTYIFEVHLARSQHYVSQSRLTGQPANYNVPAKLRVWGGNDFCDGRQLLGETALVENHNWELYEIIFSPRDNYDFILLEAYYKSEVTYAYCGHVLVDNASISLGTDELFASFSGDESIKELEETVHLEELKSRINELECNTSISEDREIDQFLFIKTTLINNVNTFDKLSQEMGLLRYVQSRSIADLTSMIRNLEGVGATQRADQLKEVIRLNMKSREETLTKKEEDLLKSYEDAKTGSKVKDDIPQLIDSYIELHKKELIEAVNACK